MDKIVENVLCRHRHHVKDVSSFSRGSEYRPCTRSEYRIMSLGQRQPGSAAIQISSATEDRSRSSNTVYPKDRANTIRY
jgi:hypothetical protein